MFCCALFISRLNSSSAFFVRSLSSSILFILSLIFVSTISRFFEVLRESSSIIFPTVSKVMNKDINVFMYLSISSIISYSPVKDCIWISMDPNSCIRCTRLFSRVLSSNVPSERMIRSPLTSSTKSADSVHISPKSFKRVIISSLSPFWIIF